MLAARVHLLGGHIHLQFESEVRDGTLGHLLRPLHRPSYLSEQRDLRAGEVTEEGLGVCRPGRISGAGHAQRGHRGRPGTEDAH